MSACASAKALTVDRLKTRTHRSVACSQNGSKLTYTRILAAKTALDRETAQLVASVVEEPKVRVVFDELAPNVSAFWMHLQDLPTNGRHAQASGGIRTPRFPTLHVLAVQKILLGGACNVSLLRKKIPLLQKGSLFGFVCHGRRAPLW